jgi:LPXTG-motif cell wall-anchored protein
MNKNTKILALLSVGAIASYFIFKKNKKVNANGCPSGMQLYYGTCIPTKKVYSDCPQGYRKETVGGDCVKMPDNITIGGCGAGEEYRMGFRLGDLTPTMGCYPIGANIDINMGSSSGYILGGESGSNIGGGGTVQGGSGNYSDTSESRYGGGQLRTNVTCGDNQVYDPISGWCVNKEVNPIFIKKTEPILPTEPTKTEKTTITCPDGYTLKNDMCYPMVSEEIVSSKATTGLDKNKIYLFAGGALLLGILVLATKKKNQ